MTSPSKPPGLSPRMIAGLGVLVLAAGSLAQTVVPGVADTLPPGVFGPPIAVPRDARSSDALLPGPKATNWVDQSAADAHQKSAGCLECHQGIEEMHSSPYVVLGCVDCHGGDPTPGLTMRKA